MTLQDYIKLADGLPGNWEQSHRQLPDGVYSTHVYTPDGETVCTVHWYPKRKEKGVIGTHREELAQFIAASRTLGPAMAKALIEAQEAMKDAEMALYCMNIPENGPERRQLKESLAKIQSLNGGG